MKKYLAILAAVALLTGCNNPKNNAPAGSAASARQAGHDHDHDHGHDHSHGPHLELGGATTAGIAYKVSQLGVSTTDDQPVEFSLNEGSSRPKAVRGWIGSESGEDATKALIELSGDHAEVHLEQPVPLPAEAKLWLEIENEAGEKGLASFELKRS